VNAVMNLLFDKKAENFQTICANPALSRALLHTIDYKYLLAVAVLQIGRIRLVKRVLCRPVSS
jgi:hypothetical protein